MEVQTQPLCQHHAVGHQRLAGVLRRPAVEGVDRQIEDPGEEAHRRRRDLTPGQGKQDLARLAGREPRHEAGEDGTVDLRRTPCATLQSFRSGRRAGCVAR